MRKIAVAGIGAIGSVIVKRLLDGMKDFELVAVSDLKDLELDIPNVSLNKLHDTADIIVECLPAALVPDLAHQVLKRDKTFICISSSALLANPGILEIQTGRLIVPSGAIAGLDGLRAMMQHGGNVSVSIKTIKKPQGLKGAPYFDENPIDLNAITSPKTVFKGNALDAAKGFPANVNVAATLSIYGPGPENMIVEIIADPNISRTTHQITYTSDVSDMSITIENKPDPDNPKSSQITALSILAVLEKLV